MHRLVRILLTGLAVVSAGTPGLAQQPGATPPDTRSHPDDLLVARCKGVVQVRDFMDDPFKKKEVTILQVSRTQVVFVERPGGAAVVKTGKYVSSVETADGKSLWVWDLAKNEFRGSPPVLPAPIDVSPRPFPKTGYSLYLLGRADALHEELNDALWSRNADRVNGLLSEAAGLVKFAKAVGAPPAVCSLFTLEGYAADQAKRAGAFADAWKDLIDAQVARGELLAAADKWAARQRTLGADALVWGGGLALLTGGGGLDIAASGLVRIFASSLVHACLVDVIKDLTAVSRKEAHARASESQSEFRRAVWQLGGLLPNAARALDLKASLFDPAVLDELVRKGDRKAVIDLLKARSDALAAKGLTHPLLAARVARLEGLLIDQPCKAEDRPRRSDDLFALAGRTADAVRWVPGDALFDADRVSVLAAAGELVHRSVTMGHGPVNWSKCFDPRADYGVRLLNRALEYGAGCDPDGDARATRAWLLFQRGLYDPALRQGQEVAPLRRWDALTQYNLARVYGKAGKAKEAAGCFYDALRVGHANVKDALSDDDLFTIRALKDTWKYLTAPNLAASVELARVVNGVCHFTLGVENNSPFPITDAVLTYTACVTDAAGRLSLRTVKTRVDYLAPNSTFYWIDALVVPGLHAAGQVAVESPNFKPNNVKVAVAAAPIRFLYRGFNLFGW